MGLKFNAFFLLIFNSCQLIYNICLVKNYIDN